MPICAEIENRTRKRIIYAIPTNYLYDGPNLTEEVGNSGNVISRYAGTREADEPLSEIRSDLTSYYYQQDGLSSVTSLSNSAGALANMYVYDSFGSLHASTGSVVNPFQYTGRDFDQETGTYEFRARYYDADIGRLLSEDPLRFVSTVSLYSYVSNRPTRFVDPTGLSQKDVETLTRFFHKTIDQMTKDGVRTDPGWWNNIRSTLGSKFLGCADQTKVVNNSYDDNRTRLGLDDSWNFQTHTSLAGAHTYGLLESSNPSDPDLLVDPLKGIVQPVPKGSR